MLAANRNGSCGTTGTTCRSARACARPCRPGSRPARSCPTPTPLPDPDLCACSLREMELEAAPRQQQQLEEEVGCPCGGSEAADQFERLHDAVLLDVLNRIGDVKALGRCALVSRRFHALVPLVDSVFVRVDCVIPTTRRPPPPSLYRAPCRTRR